MTNKYILGVAHNGGEENKAIEVLKKHSRPGDVVAIELEPLTAKVVRATLSETITNPNRLREILDDCDVPFSFYWANLIRLSYINNLRLRFLPIENRKVLEDALPYLDEYERRDGNMSRRKMDEFIQRYIFDREKCFGQAVKTHNPNGIIVGTEHLDYFRDNFPGYRKVYEYKGEFSAEESLVNRIKVLRKRQR